MQQDPGALYDFNLDEELEIDLDDEAMEAMFGQDLTSDNDILGMWIPEVLDWPTWVCVTAAGAALTYFPALLFRQLTNNSLMSHPEVQGFNAEVALVPRNVALFMRFYCFSPQTR